MIKTIYLTKIYIENLKLRSSWEKGVRKYAIELLEQLEMHKDYINIPKRINTQILEKYLLNGAPNWIKYSREGCSLIYNEDIAKRLCNNTELKRTKFGEKSPNVFEDWLDVQARALYQAFILIKHTIRKIQLKGEI